MKFALATANEGKIKEMCNILSSLGIEVVTRDELDINLDIEETGTTFAENARLKAVAICKLSKMPSIADDSGLVVNALNGEPGVYTSSYGGEKLTTKERYEYLLKNMENMEQRNAKFVCNIVCAFPSGKELIATGECSGSIATIPIGDGGFGYDPVFIPDGYKKTMAELSSDEKNAISHRSKALNNFVELLKSNKSSGECV